MTIRELEVVDPFTEQVLVSLPLATEKEAEAMVARAKAVQRDWGRTALAERVRLCEAWLGTFEARRDTTAREITQQMGKPLRQSLNEVSGTLDRARYMISIAEETLADEYLPEKPNFTRYIRHEPKGVVLDIAAWNYPLLIAVNIVVPAVLAGNAVILKHSSRTPLCGRAFVESFERAGAPSGLVQDLVADHGLVSRLIAHPDIDHVSFTGSVRGGHEVNRAAAERFMDVGLELGGKDPAYVCADAPFAYAVENLVDGVLYNAGQSCCAVERIYVERPIYARFLEAFVERTRAYVTMGDPMDAETTLGPMASQGAAAFLDGQVTEAVSRGGRLAVDGASFARPPHGWFAAPAVVADAPQDCRLMQEESFGPVVGIRAVENDAEAIRMMNDSAYGLSASVWTADAARAARIGAAVETGTFFMNRCDYLDPALPWTGVKDTGRGASLSRYGLLNLTRLKSMHLRTSVG